MVNHPQKTFVLKNIIFKYMEDILFKSKTKPTDHIEVENPFFQGIVVNSKGDIFLANHGTRLWSSLADSLRK